MRTTRHPADRCKARFIACARALRELEKRFDAFMRAHRDDEAERQAYAHAANLEYFRLKEAKAKAARLYRHHSALSARPTCRA